MRGFSKFMVSDKNKKNFSDEYLTILLT
jgi:hypothetical protein